MGNNWRRVEKSQTYDEVFLLLQRVNKEFNLLKLTAVVANFWL